MIKPVAALIALRLRIKAGTEQMRLSGNLARLNGQLHKESLDTFIDNPLPAD